MARLALVRKRREEAQAKKAEEEAGGEGASGKEKMEKEAKAKAGGGGPQKLNPLEVSCAVCPSGKPASPHSPDRAREWMDALRSGRPPGGFRFRERGRPIVRPVLLPGSCSAVQCMSRWT